MILSLISIKIITVGFAQDIMLVLMMSLPPNNIKVTDTSKNNIYFIIYIIYIYIHICVYLFVFNLTINPDTPHKNHIIIAD